MCFNKTTKTTKLFFFASDFCGSAFLLKIRSNANHERFPPFVSCLKLAANLCSPFVNIGSCVATVTYRPCSSFIFISQRIYRRKCVC